MRLPAACARCSVCRMQSGARNLLSASSGQSHCKLASSVVVSIIMLDGAFHWVLQHALPLFCMVSMSEVLYLRRNTVYSLMHGVLSGRCRVRQGIFWAWESCRRAVSCIWAASVVPSPQLHFSLSMRVWAIQLDWKLQAQSTNRLRWDWVAPQLRLNYGMQTLLQLWRSDDKVIAVESHRSSRYKHSSNVHHCALSILLLIFP